MKRSLSLSLVISCCYFSSCVYFNTFYNAESSYKEALIIIEESPILEDDRFPAQAKKLLGDAIDNSKIVLKKYPESKYVDDAIFIIAKASFLRGESAIAESYFKQLLRDYPESKYVELSEIWLAYTFLRMDLVEQAKNKMNLIVMKKHKDKERKYLIYNILAEIALIENNIVDVYINYEKAAEFSPVTSKKVSMYSKLVLIAEKKNDKVKASEYLLSLANIAPDAIRISSRMKWVQYQRELGNFEAVSSEIQRLLSLSEFSSEYMQLELELGKVYKARADNELAKEMFGIMVEKYSQQRNKDEMAEVYYHLGIMALMEDFNMDLAMEYFDNSKKAKSASFYGRASKDMITKINQYESLLKLYSETISNDNEMLNQNDKNMEEKKNDVNVDIDRMKMNEKAGNYRLGEEFNNKNFPPEVSNQRSNDVRPDSLLFMIGEMLLYDFNHKELAFSKFKMLPNEYPGSPFAEQSLYVLSFFDIEGSWLSNLEEMYPFSKFLNPDSVQVDTSIVEEMQKKRDYAWSMAEISHIDSYIEFTRLHEEYNDTLSGYIRAYVSDYYLNDIRQTIQDYKDFIDNYPEHGYSSRVNERLKIIEKDLEIQKSISQQAVDYKNAIQYFKNTHDFDSTKLMLDGVISGEKSKYREAANTFNSVLRRHGNISSMIQNLKLSYNGGKLDTTIVDTLKNNDSNFDSLLYVMGNLFYHELEILDSAKFYYENLIIDHEKSKYRPNALQKLFEINQDDRWARILSKEYPDSSFINDSISVRLAYDVNIFNDDFIASHDDLINSCDVYLNFFTNSEDSVGLLMDTSVVMIDTLIIIENDELDKIDDEKIIVKNDVVLDTVIDNEQKVEKEVDLIKLDEITISKDDMENENIEKNVINNDELDKSYYMEYVVKKGETLYGIAELKLGDAKNWSLIYEWNKEVMDFDSTLIYPYQILQIKTELEINENINENKSTYLVKQGDSLWDIATKVYGDPYAWQLIVHDNKVLFDDPNKIIINQKLMIRLQL